MSVTDIASKFLDDLIDSIAFNDDSIPNNKKRAKKAKEGIIL